MKEKHILYVIIIHFIYRVKTCIQILTFIKLATSIFCTFALYTIQSCIILSPYIRVHLSVMLSIQEEVDYLLFRGKCLGVSNIRFMPKASSLRPITNLGKAAKLNSAQFPLSKVRQREIKSVNSQLIDLFNVLKFEKVPQ